MHSKQLQCTAESLTVQQEALSHSRKFCYIAKKVSPEVETGEKFLLRQKLEKSQSCGRNWRKVSPAAETGEKFLLRQKLEKRQSCGRNQRKFSPRQKLETQFAHKPDQVELQLDRSQLPYSEILWPIIAGGSPAHYRRRQPNLTKKGPYIKMATPLGSWDQDRENEIFLPRKHVSKSLPK